MIFPVLLKKEIEDIYTQENFKRLGEYFRIDPVTRCRFEFLETVIPGSVTNMQVFHRLGYVPKDVILLHNSTNATVTFGYSLFTDEAVYVTSSAATTLRFLVGRYE